MVTGILSFKAARGPEICRLRAPHTGGAAGDQLGSLQCAD